jgi:hypothetical protein
MPVYPGAFTNLSPYQFCSFGATNAAVGRRELDRPNSGKPDFVGGWPHGSFVQAGQEIEAGLAEERN